MGAYLYERRAELARPQYRSPRRARPTGLTVIHTAEPVLDTIGPDTGAENVARYMVGRDNPGSYHDLVDSDTAVQLVLYGDEAYQDATGSNPYGLSISFALRTTDWSKLTDRVRAAFLRQGAIAFARQQAWLRAHGHATTPLRRISRTESAAGVAGFITHAARDPDRRSDPGTNFPWSEFFAACRVALAGTTPLPTTPPDPEDDDMTPQQWQELVGDRLDKLLIPTVQRIEGGVALLVDTDARVLTVRDELIAAIRADDNPDPTIVGDPAALAAALAAALPAGIAGQVADELARRLTAGTD